MNARYKQLSVLTAAALALLAGCSSGSNTAPLSSASGSRAGKGSVKITIHWPDAPKSRLSRLIPVASNSINIELTAPSDPSNGRVFDFATHTLVARPTTGNTTSVTIGNLPAADKYTETATAYPNADGSGQAQAVGSISNISVKNSELTTTPDLTMNTTIKSLAVTPSATTAAAGGAAVSLSATAKDANGNVVLTAPANITWTSDHTNLGQLTPSGNPATLTPLAMGTVNVTATETESKITSAAVAITLSAAAPPPAAVDMSKVFVADVANHRVVGLDKVPATTFTVYDGTQGGGAAFAGGPADIAVDPQGRLYIADYPYGIIRVDDLSGKNRVAYDPNTDPVKSGPALGASAVYVDTQGRIYWRDDNFAINRMDDMTGKNHVFFTSANFGAPAAIATDGQGRIYVADGNGSISGAKETRGHIYRFDDMTGSNPHSFTGDGISAPLSMALTGKILDIDAAGELYVADNGNKRIVRLDPSALDDATQAHLVAFPMPNDSTGVPLSVNSVAVTHGTAPTLYFTASGKGVGDEYVFHMDDINGTNLVKYGSTGSGSGQFAAPVGIAVK